LLGAGSVPPLLLMYPVHDGRTAARAAHEKIQDREMLAPVIMHLIIIG
jgi:hypothetical protein